MGRLLFLIIVIVMSLVMSIAKWNNTLGTMENHFDTEQSGREEIVFEGKKDEWIDFSYSSNVKKGTLHMILSDSSGNVMVTFENGESSSKEIYLKKDDTYTVSVVYDDFAGSYVMTVK